MNNSYLVTFADIEDPNCWLERFEGHSLKEVQDKIRQYIENEYDLEEELPLNYNEMKKHLLKEYNILIGNIEDIETI